nr:nitroreductase family protein [Herbidospora galbida]
MVWQPDVVSLVEPGDGREALEAVVEAATWAPSIHNTQPWSFAVAGEEISLRADMDRRLPFSDPRGRQLLISCGAALFNMKTAIRAMDRAPIVRTLPDPDRPSLLATVRIGPPEPAGEEVRTIRHEIPRRRTHRGGFTDRPLPAGVLGTLVTEAAQEGGRLIPLTSETSVEMLAALTSVAQEAHAGDPDFDLEMIRWGRRPGSGRRDGVPADAYLRPGREPPRFPQRDYSRGQGWGGDVGEAAGAEVGVVALLTTPGDDRIDWLHAGQALQRVLLHAAVHGIGAAFHTQSLEYPNLRDFVRTELCSKEFPQVLIRLGYPDGTTRGVRRPLSEVLSEEHDR